MGSKGERVEEEEWDRTGLDMVGDDGGSEGRWAESTFPVQKGRSPGFGAERSPSPRDERCKSVRRKGKVVSSSSHFSMSFPPFPDAGR